MGTNVEWYTPPEILDVVHEFFPKGIDLDPASCEQANKNVKAKTFFTNYPELDKGGLMLPWYAQTLWCNPPWGREHNKIWSYRVVQQYTLGNFKEGLYLCPAFVGASWFQPLLHFPQCFVKGRVSFINAEGKQVKGNQYDVAITYFGSDKHRFAECFSKLGYVK